MPDYLIAVTEDAQETVADSIAREILLQGAEQWKETDQNVW